jgi:hypothetical protein
MNISPILGGNNLAVQRNANYPRLLGFLNLPMAGKLAVIVNCLIWLVN